MQDLFARVGGNMSILFALSDGGGLGRCISASPDAHSAFLCLGSDCATVRDVFLHPDWRVRGPDNELMDEGPSGTGIESQLFRRIAAGESVTLTATGVDRLLGCWKISMVSLLGCGGGSSGEQMATGGAGDPGGHRAEVMVMMSIVSDHPNGPSSSHTRPLPPTELEVPSTKSHQQPCSPLLWRVSDKGDKSLKPKGFQLGVDCADDDSWAPRSCSALSRASSRSSPIQKVSSVPSSRAPLVGRSSTWDCMSGSDAEPMTDDSMDNMEAMLARPLHRRITSIGRDQSCLPPAGARASPGTPRGMTRSKSHENMTVMHDSDSDTEPTSQRMRRLSSGGASVAIDEAGSDSPWWMPVHQQLFLSIELMLVSTDPAAHTKMKEMGTLGESKFTACASVEEALSLCKSRHYLPDIVVTDAGSWEFIAKLQDSSSQVDEVAVIFLVPGNSQLVTVPDDGVADYVGIEDPQHIVVERILAQVNKKKVKLMLRDVQASNLLLENVFPSNIVKRLKKDGAREVGSPRGPQILSKHDSVTILFSDIVEYTDLAARASTDDVVMLLDTLFMAFDSLCDVHGVAKVETIGDAYMVVAGHDGRPGHAERMAAMAVDMLEAARHIKKPHSQDHVQIRIGLHSGPVSSGVVGRKCPRYCYFGDTVNTASRMESHGVPMAVHLSGATAAMLSSVRLLSCGVHNVKGKGSMKTYVICPEESVLDKLVEAIKAKAIKEGKTLTDAVVKQEEEEEEEARSTPGEEELEGEATTLSRSASMEKEVFLMWGEDTSTLLLAR